MCVCFWCVQISYLGLPADAGVVASPGETVTVGTLVNVTFTVMANGPGVSNSTGVNLGFPIDLNFLGVTVTDPAGKGEWACNGWWPWPCQWVGTASGWHFVVQTPSAEMRDSTTLHYARSMFS